MSCSEFFIRTVRVLLPLLDPKDPNLFLLSSLNEVVVISMILRSPLKWTFPHLHSSFQNGQGGTRSTFGFSGHVQASMHTQCPQNTSLFIKHQIDLCKMSVEDFFNWIKGPTGLPTVFPLPYTTNSNISSTVSSVLWILSWMFHDRMDQVFQMIWLFKTFSFFDEYCLWSCESRPVDATVLKTIWTELAYQREAKIFLLSLIQIKEMQKLR